LFNFKKHIKLVEIPALYEEREGGQFSVGAGISPPRKNAHTIEVTFAHSDRAWANTGMRRWLMVAHPLRSE